VRKRSKPEVIETKAGGLLCQSQSMLVRQVIYESSFARVNEDSR
jgi:hypothetical protein